MNGSSRTSQNLVRRNSSRRSGRIRARQSRSSGNIGLGNNQTNNNAPVAAAEQDRTSAAPADQDRTSVVAADQNNGEVTGTCNCGPDLYTRVLGPTADESILAGLQTVIDLCTKLRGCEAQEEEPEEVPVRDDSSPPVPPPTSTEPPPPALEEPVQPQTAPAMLSAGFQVSPNTRTEETQTAPYPEMVSEILQTIGLTPEQASAIVQTSLMSLSEPDRVRAGPQRTSLASMFMQTSNPSLHSTSLQTTYPDLKFDFTQTSNSLPDVPDPPRSSTPVRRPPSVNRRLVEEDIPPIPPPVLDENRSIKSALKSSEDIPKSSTTPLETTIGDEHKCISPPEPPVKGKTCKCCKCSSSSNLRKDSSTSTKGSARKKTCNCGEQSKSRRVRSSRSSTSTVGDIEKPAEVKYAVTRISKFKDFTTFEVMKSTKNQPSKMPKSIEGVFVLKKGKDVENGKTLDEKKNKSREKDIETGNINEKSNKSVNN